MLFRHPQLFDQRHAGPAAVAKNPVVILQALVSGSDRVADAVAAPDPALEELIAAAQVGVVARFDIKGGFGRSQKSKAGMGNGEGEGSTGRDALRPDSSGPRSRDHAENVLD